MSLIRNTFKRLHYHVDIIAQSVRWYLAYSLSLSNLEEMMAEHGVVVDNFPLYRVVNTAGHTIDFLLTAKRDAAAALRFFRKTIRYQVQPEWGTIDKSGANTAALFTVNADKADEEAITVSQSKYLNNRIEKNHRNIKRRIRLMLGFKSFRRAQTLLAGIDQVKIIRKGQLHRPAGDGLLPVEKLYLLIA